MEVDSIGDNKHGRHATGDKTRNADEATHAYRINDVYIYSGYT
jgi:hypothetical protein